MERRVQERLVGAAVLMAAAIILIPEMLSGPDRAPEQDTARASSESNVKTYTIDLADPPAGQSQSSGQRSVPHAVEAPHVDSPSAESGTAATPARAASPPESVQSIPEAAPPPEDESAAPVRAAPTSESTTREAMSEPARRSEPPAAPPARTRTEESAPAALASSPSVPTTKGFAVQLGSFSSAASAQRLANEFRAEGFDAFVMPVKTGATTLYRVRLGPMKDRAGAEGVLKRAKVKVAGAAIVAHP